MTFLSNTKGLYNKIDIISIVAITMSLFHLYTGGFGVLPSMQQRSAHLAFALSLTVLLFPMKKHVKGLRGALIDGTLIALIIIFNGYVFFYEENIALRAGEPTPIEIVLGFIALGVLLGTTMRTNMRAIAWIAFLAILYLFVGNYLPGILQTRPFSIDLIMTPMYLSVDGIYGIVTGVSAKLIFLFILFGYFLRDFGLGDFFIRFATSLTGGIRGGPPQVAVIASCLFGSISGSAVANIVATGSFTIPMMKRLGYPPAMAGAVEAAASTGGQFMPPVMAAAGFIIAEVLGITYIEVVYAALLPGVLYFATVGVTVYLESAKMGMAIIPKEERPKIGGVLKNGWHLLIPLIILIYLLAVVKFSPMLSAFYSILSMVILDIVVRRNVKSTLEKCVVALRDGAKGAVEIAILCACASVVVGVINLTGKGLEFSILLLDISMGSIIILLLASMGVSLILGMGLPTTACYILLAVTVVPGLVNGGVLPIAAHLFIFYFGIFSVLTLPVAAGIYAASALANSPLIPTAIKAMKFSFVGYLLPYLFVYNPALLMIGHPLMIIKVTLWALLLFCILALILCGHCIKKIGIIERILLGLSLVGFLFMVEPIYQFISLIFLILGLGRQITHLISLSK